MNATGAILGPFDSLVAGSEARKTSAPADPATLRQCPRHRRLSGTTPGRGQGILPARLPTHPGHAIAAAQSKGFGGIVSFSLKEDTQEAATAFVTSTGLFKLAESLGGIKSLVSHPAQMTHKTIPTDRRRAAGVHDSLIRLSTGLEDTEDLIEDLRQALDKLWVEQHETTNISGTGRVIENEQLLTA